MKEAVTQAFRKLPKWTNRVIIKFFFNARAVDSLEKSSLGMYRALTYQLLTALPHLQDCFVEQFRSKRKSSDDDDVRWRITELQNFLLEIVERLGDHSIFIFIDALDECAGEDVRALVHFLQDLSQEAVDWGKNISICLSSRHYPYISIRSAYSLTLEEQVGHEQDISHYIANKLVVGSDLQEEIRRKASGVFLWVALVVDILNDSDNRGETAIKKRLDEIPEDLDTLFHGILTRHPEQKEKAILLFQWMLFATRQLRPLELYWAVQSGFPAECEDSEPKSEESVQRFILHNSKGLTEISKSKPPTVQFIHETVRTFFQNGGLSSIQQMPQIDVPGLSHDRLKSCCFEYWRSDQVQEKELQKVDTERPFLEYAVANIFRHSDFAEQEGVAQKNSWRLHYMNQCGRSGSSSGTTLKDSRSASTR